MIKETNVTSIDISACYKRIFRFLDRNTCVYYITYKNDFRKKVIVGKEKAVYDKKKSVLKRDKKDGKISNRGRITVGHFFT